MQRQTIALATLTLGLLAANTRADQSTEKVTYDDNVAEIFRTKCFNCHNQNKKSGDLDLTSFTNLMVGGASGAVIEPGDPDASYLWSLITHESEPAMPPNSPKLPDETLATVKKWIELGALENKGSKAMIKKKPKFDFALSGAPSGKPEVPPMPDVLNVAPVVVPPKRTAVTAVATSPWAPLVAVAGQKQVILYHSQTLEPLGVLPFPEGTAHVLKFSRNGQLLLAGGGRGSYKGLAVVWNVATGERVFEIGDELDAVLAADISADHTMVALGGPNRIVRVYTTSDGELAYELTKHTEWIYSLEFSPDGVLLATGDRNGGMFVWEAHTGREYLTLKAHSAAVTAISWRSDSNILVSGSEDGTIRLWEMNNGGQPKNWGSHGGVASVEFCRDGRIVTCGRDRFVRIWDQNGAQQRQFEQFGDLALRVTHCDETNRVIAGDWTGAIRVWDAPEGNRVGELEQNPPKLDTRLAQANQSLTALNAEQAKLAAAYDAAKAALDKVKADLAAQNKRAAEAKKQNDAAAANVNSTKQVLATLAKEVETAAAREATLKQATPQLQQAAAKAAEAQQMMTDDKELAEIAQKLKAKADASAKELATVTKTLTDKKAAQTKAQTDLANYEKQATDSAAVMVDAKKQIEALTAAVKPAEEAATKAKQSADAGAAQVQLAQRNVERWTNYIGLRDELKVLTDRQAELDTLELAVAEVDVELKEAQVTLDTANTATGEAQKQVEAAVNAVTAVKQTMTKLTQERDAANQAAAKLQPALGPLGEALAKLNEAATKAPEDKELSASATQLKSLVDGKNAAVAGYQKTVTDRNAALETAKKDLAAKEKAVTDTNATLAAAKKRVVEVTAAMGPVQQKAEAARKAATAGAGQVEAARQVVETRRTKLRPVLNIQQANAG